MAFKRKDILLKSMIEDFPVDFVRFFYPDAESLFNLEAGFEFMDNELRQVAPDNEFMQDNLAIDKLLKGKSNASEAKGLLLLVEVQGYKDTLFAERVFTYFTRLIDKYGHKVIVLAVYTDTVKSFVPTFLAYQLSDTRNKFDFKTYKVLEQKEALLANEKNIIALFMLTVLLALKHERKKGSDENLLRSKITLLNNLKSRGLPSDQEVKVLSFIRLYANFANPKMIDKFEEQLKLIIGKSKDMGIIEFAIQEAAQEAKELGIEQGIESKNTSFVKNLLLKGKLSNAEIAEVAEVPIEFVKAIKCQLAEN